MTAQSLMLAAGGKCLARIVLPDNPNVIEEFARDELIRYCERMTAVAAQAKAPSAGMMTTVRFIRQATEKPLWFPATDRFAIAVEGQEISLTGTSRALLYAVYHLLEHCGARFTIPGKDDEMLPVQDRLVLSPHCAAHEEAEFVFRAIDLEWLVKRDWPLVMDHIDWMGKNRFNIFSTHPDAYGYDFFSTDPIRFKDLEPLIIPELEKRGIALNVGIHTAFYFLSPKKYLPEHKDWYAFKSHSAENHRVDEADQSWCAAASGKYQEPELQRLDFLLNNLDLYFRDPVDVQPLMGTLGANNLSPADRLAGLSLDQGMEIPTQIHYTNPEAIRTYCDNLLEYLGAHPYVGIIGVWPTDVNHYCSCEKCAANPGAHVDAVLYVARRVAREFPNVLVEHLLYTGTSMRLPDEQIKLPENLVVAAGGGDDGGIWAKRCRHDGAPGVYRYNLAPLADNFANYGRVQIAPKRVVEMMAFIRQNGLSGYTVFYIDMLSFWRSSQNIALLSKMSWNRNLSPDAYLDDFCAAYFMTAGDFMRRLYGRLFEMNEQALFVEASEEDYATLTAILNECRQWLQGARDGVGPDDRGMLAARLDKVAVYLEHLALHAQATRRRTQAKDLLNKNRIRDAALAMHQAAIALEGIKSMCLESYLRGDGVLDFRLTLTLRKLVSFPENRKLVESMLNRIKRKMA